ncbi:MAG: response regulator transcription factor [Cyclobacteriaceae bacterium]|nr:response regulator transcription factor [Cyclobacteriaceae bacterium]
MLDFRTRIVIIEDNEAVKDGYALILSSNSGYNVVGTYTTAEEALKNLRKDNPDVIFTDLDLPGMDGITGIRKIKKLDPKIKIIVITVYEDSTMVFDALVAGASGYITKSSNHVELLQAVDQIMHDGAPMSPKIAKMVVSSFQRSTDTPLSNRETEILSLLATGKTYKIAADELNIGIETVKSHVKNIYSKLHANSKSEALEIARRDNLI